MDILVLGLRHEDIEYVMTCSECFNKRSFLIQCLKLKSGSERSDTIQVAVFLLRIQDACSTHVFKPNYILALTLYRLLPT